MVLLGVRLLSQPSFGDSDPSDLGWYYFGPREEGVMPKHPTMAALFRASTLSLGSIAFGSLIVTILEIIRLILQAVRNNANSDGHRELIFSKNINHL